MKKAIFITGASSGIGAALSHLYAKDDNVVIGIVARRLDRLEAIKKHCESEKSKVIPMQADVTDAEAMERVAAKFLKTAGRIDVVIANAGLASHPHPAMSDFEVLRQMVNVNIVGVLNTFAPFLPAMVKQGSGQLVAVSSIAGFLKLPGGVYSATKAAIRYLMDGWRMDLADHGINVTTIFPGFVESELTQPKRKWYPFLVSSKKAAQLMKKAIEAKKRNYIFPWQWRVIVPILRLFPGLLGRGQGLFERKHRK